MIISMESLNRAGWTSTLAEQFTTEIASDLGIESLRIKVAVGAPSATGGGARRRLLAIEATVTVDCSSKEDAAQIRLLAEVMGLTGAASRSGIRGAVRMIFLDILDLATPASTPGPTVSGSVKDGVEPGPTTEGTMTPSPSEAKTVQAASAAAKAEQASTSTGIFIAVGSAAGAAIFLVAAVFLVRRYRMVKERNTKLEQVKHFHNLLQLSRGVVMEHTVQEDELRSSNSGENQLMTASLEFGSDSGSSAHSVASGSSSSSEESIYDEASEDEDDLSESVPTSLTRSSPHGSSIEFGSAPSPMALPRGIKRTGFMRRGSPASGTVDSASPLGENSGSIEGMSPASSIMSMGRSSAEAVPPAPLPRSHSRRHDHERAARADPPVATFIRAVRGAQGPTPSNIPFIPRTRSMVTNASSILKRAPSIEQDVDVHTVGDSVPDGRRRLPFLRRVPSLDEADIRNLSKQQPLPLVRATIVVPSSQDARGREGQRDNGGPGGPVAVQQCTLEPLPPARPSLSADGDLMGGREPTRRRTPGSIPSPLVVASPSNGSTKGNRPGHLGQFSASPSSVLRGNMSVGMSPYTQEYAAGPSPPSAYVNSAWDLASALEGQRQGQVRARHFGGGVGEARPLGRNLVWDFMDEPGGRGTTGPKWDFMTSFEHAAESQNVQYIEGNKLSSGIECGSYQEDGSDDSDDDGDDMSLVLDLHQIEALGERESPGRRLSYRHNIGGSIQGLHLHSVEDGVSHVSAQNQQNKPTPTSMPLVQLTPTTTSSISTIPLSIFAQSPTARRVARGNLWGQETPPTPSSPAVTRRAISVPFAKLQVGAAGSPRTSSEHAVDDVTIQAGMESSRSAQE